MKKLFATMLAVLATGATYALPVGNPSEASLLCDGLFWEGNCCDNSFDVCDPCFNWCDAFSLRVGFYGDYVFNRHLNQPRTGLTSDDDSDNEPDFDVEHTQLYTNAGYIALNFWNRVDFFTSLGTTNLILDTNALRLTGANDGARAEIETDSRFSWSVGGRVTLWECGCTALGFEGQYFRTCTHVKRVTLGADNSVYPFEADIDVDNNDRHPRYTEWQVGLGLSHHFNFIVPYIAVKYARAFWDFGARSYLVPDTNDTGIAGFVTPGDLRADKNWGFAVGTSIVDCEKAALTVEGRFGDEKAVYVNGQIRF